MPGETPEEEEEEKSHFRVLSVAAEMMRISLKSTARMIPA
jgi:hypothetical protein